MPSFPLNGEGVGMAGINFKNFDKFAVYAKKGHGASMDVKYSVKNHTAGLLLLVKFHPYRSRVVGYGSPMNSNLRLFSSLCHRQHNGALIVVKII